MNDILFKAILSMDSYSRGYDPAIKFGNSTEAYSIDTVGTKIGNATIYDTAGDANAQAVGFYAVAYNYNGETIIAYRGTDKNISVPFISDSGSDMYNGYGVFSGIADVPQARMAFTFYNDVAKQLNNGVPIDPRDANISLTGHSLGGGLAGLVGSVYEKNGALFDNMTFELAAKTAQVISDPLLALVNDETYDEDYKNLVYGNWGTDGKAWAPTISSDTNSLLQTYSIAGEFLFINRAFQQTPERTYNLGNNSQNFNEDSVSLSSLPIAENFARHSMATLVIRLFAEYGSSQGAALETNWYAAAKYFWPAMYDDKFVQSFGEKDAATVRTKIAYSAIDEGTRVFGDTGIRALYDDANDFGKALSNAGTNNVIRTQEYATDISKVFVQFASTLALNEIEKSDGWITLYQNVVDGVLTFNTDPVDPSIGSFDVSFIDPVWKIAGGGDAPKIVARDNIVGGIITDSGDETSLRAQAKQFWGDGSNDVFARVVFGLEGFATARIEDVIGITPDKATLYVGMNGNDRVIGSSGNDLILGGKGDDTILTSGSGTDIIFGGVETDTFFADFGEDYFDGGSQVDTIDYTVRDQFEILNNGTGNGIRIEADLVKGTVDRSLINGGNKSTDYINNVEKVIGASGDDVFKGKEGVVGQGFTGNGETTERGDKVDFSDYTATNGGITVDLNAGTGTDSAGGTYTTLDGIEQIIGTNAADTISGDGSDNWLFGNNGIDTINGGAGDDRIIGGAGNDILRGGGDNDTFYLSASAQQPLLLQTGIDTITDSAGTNDIVYLSGGYQFNLNSFTYSGTQLSISGAANITNSTDIEFVEYSDGAKFRVDRLILKEADATTFAASGSILAGDGESNTLSASSGILLVNGNGGDDWLRGFESNDLTLDGGAGSDYLFGTSGNTLNGGSGNDYLDGQLNNNVKYQASSGIDVIKDGGANGNLEISSAFTLWRADNGSLVVDYSGATTPDEVIASTNKVIVLDQFNGGGIETINGGAISIDTIALLGTSIDDYLQGDGANDVFASSKGDDVYDGGTGANTFSFAANDVGSTLVRTTPDAQADLLIFNGLNQSDVSVIRDASIGTDNLLFSYGQSFAIVENAVLDILNADNINVQFADTSALTFASIDLTTRGSNQADTLDGDVPGFSVDDIIFGGAGDDVINGNSGNDTIYGGVGNDTIDSGAGSDLIIDGFGDDIYTVGKGDRVVLGSGDNTIDFAVYEAASGDSATTYTAELPQNIALSDTFLWRDASGTIILNYGANSVALDSVFNPIIDFANDPDLTPEQMVLTTFGDGSDENISDAIYGYLDGSNQFHISGQQDDIIYANGGNDDIVVTGGNDIVYGGAGDDTIGVGINTQNEFIATAYVKFYGEGGNDVLGISAFSGELYGGAGNDELVGNTGIDILDGGDGDDWISTQGGDDTVNGGAGDDTIIGLANGIVTVDAGDGNDLIVLEDSADDIIDGGAGLDTLSFESIFALTTAQIDLSTQSANMDGTNFSFTNIEGVIGSQGDDTITGSAANNYLDGGAGFGGFLAGNDLLKGEGGDDTYFFGTSFNPRTPPSAGSTTSQPPVVGDDIVDDASGSSDTIEFSDYFVLSDLSFNMVGNNLVISFVEGSVTILNQTGSGKVENLKLSDGSVLNLDDYAGWIVGTPGVDNLTGTADNQTIYGAASDDILNAYISGSSLAGGLGNDILNGNAGNDILGGGAGNDTIFGGAGDDVYLFSPGDGFDVISDTSGFDTLSILDAITFSDLVFTKVGNDLQIDIASGVTITDFYSGDPNLILEQIQFSDGTSFDLTTLLVPVAQDDVFTADQDTIVTGNVLVDNGNGADSDSDGGILSVVAGTFATTNGSVTILANGDFTYTPNAGYIGFDSFTYTLNDGQGNSDVGTANITLNFVAPPNTAPIAQDDVFSGNQDLNITGNLLVDNGNGVDSDPDGDAISVIAQTIATTNGSVVIAANGDFTYTPNAGYTGTDSFTYTLQDSLGATDTALASITINASANNNPVAVADIFAGNEDAVISGNVLTNDTDADNDTLSVTAATLTTANGGAVNLLADGSFTYTPALNFNGSDSFTYTVLDGQGASDIGTVTLNVTAVNDAPLAIDDSATTNEDAVITINVLGNDSDIDGDALNVTAVSGAVNGSAIINADNTITYTPNADFNGTETLTYTVDDGNGGSATATVNITIDPVNDNPVANDDNVSGNQDTVITGNVLSNDSDIDGDILSVTAATLTTANGGAVNLLSDGSFTYTPSTGYAGNDSFTYIVEDGQGGSDSAVVNISVIASNSPPVAGDDIFNLLRDNDLSGNVLLNDNDVDGDILNVQETVITTAQGGSVTMTSTGDFVYSPALGFIGTDTFEYVVFDTSGEQDSASVTINVAARPDDIFGDDGRNYLFGTSADDAIFAGAGNDYLIGKSGDDLLIGEDGRDVLIGNRGDDSLLGGAGRDVLYGGSDNDYLSGGIEGDWLFGGSGSDVLDGGDGDDRLYAGWGDDILSSGDGNDILVGGSGADTYVFDANSNGVDAIKDFKTSQGDVLDISDLLEGYDPLSDAITDFVQITDSGSNSILSIDVDGGSDNFVQIATLSNVTGLTDEDALLTSGNLIAA